METSTQAFQLRDYSLAEHGHRRHDITVKQNLTREQVTDRSLYVHVARQFQIGDEIRLLAESMEFMARLIVLYAQGSVVKLHCLEYHELIPVDYASVSQDEFDVKLRGPRRWCIINTETGETIKEDIPDHATALKELSQYRKALAA